MATEEVEMSNQEHLAEFDADMALQRLEVEPGDLTAWDLDTAVKRGELEERLDEIDAELEETLAAIEADDEQAAFSSGVVEFCGAGTPCKAAGDMVRRRGVIWRAGSYSTHDFEMSPFELAEYARTFKPVPIRHAHSAAAGPLDGGLGELESVEMAADGRTLMGVAVFPRWLEERLGDARRFVSATFDRATRRMRSLDLVLYPEIPDAELLAAFAVGTAATVTRDVVLFKVGDESSPVYRPDAKAVQGASLTKAQLARAVEKVRLPMAVEGGPYRATLTKVVLGEGGNSLIGTLSMTPATDEALARMKVRIRTVFDRELRILTGLQLHEQSRPTEVIDSPASFNQPQSRPAMSYETDEQYAARVCA